jgi:hypothetical protein
VPRRTGEFPADLPGLSRGKRAAAHAERQKCERSHESGRLNRARNWLTCDALPHVVPGLMRGRRAISSVMASAAGGTSASDGPPGGELKGRGEQRRERCRFGRIARDALNGESCQSSTSTRPVSAAEWAPESSTLLCRRLIESVQHEGAGPAAFRRVKEVLRKRA